MTGYIIIVIFISVKQVFSDLDFLGWYNTGDVPNESDVKIHKQVQLDTFILRY